MNSNIKVHLLDDDSLLEVKQVSEMLKESTEHVRKMKRSIEEFREFNQKAKEFLENTKAKGYR